MCQCTKYRHIFPLTLHEKKMGEVCVTYVCLCGVSRLVIHPPQPPPPTSKNLSAKSIIDILGATILQKILI